MIHVAIAGNPNCGKTTLFNALTGSRQRVGNWPGVTVDRHEGAYDFESETYGVTDLPGIYSFSAFAPDEAVARRYILTERPQVVVNIVDATQLERNLYLTTQLIEIRAPMVVALNMMDLARRRHIEVDVAALARHLGCPVVPISASRGEGLSDLRAAIRDRAQAATAPSPVRVPYDERVEAALRETVPQVAAVAAARGVDARWLAVKLLEGDAIGVEYLGHKRDEAIRAWVQRLEQHIGEPADMILADGRYGFIHGLARTVVRRRAGSSHPVTEVVDRLVLHRWIGVPLFLAVMYLMFTLTMALSGPWIDFIDAVGGTLLVSGLGRLLSSWGAAAWLVEFLATGVGGGLTVVATFVPPIAFIFLFLAVLEDSGYMARGAFVMDRFLRLVGLPGKAFIPMILGFGCNVPAILATRTLEHRRDRLLAVLMNPLMSCSARLPVYTIFAAAFFPGRGGTIVFALYGIGLALAVLTGLLLRRTLLRGPLESFVMELPPYHLPTWRGIFFHTGQRLWDFIVRAGQVIVLVVIVLTTLGALGPDGSFGAREPGDSILGLAGRAMTPVLRPMGITDDNWPAAVALVSGLFAKEAVIGALSTMYVEREESAAAAAGDDEPGLGAALGAAGRQLGADLAALGSALWRPGGLAADGAMGGAALETMRRRFGSRAAAFAYLLFILVYAPCLATVAAIGREAGWRWAVFELLYLTGLAWLVSMLFFQTTRLAVAPGPAAAWLAGGSSLIVLWVVLLRVISRPRSPATIL